MALPNFYFYYCAANMCSVNFWSHLNNQADCPPVPVTVWYSSRSCTGPICPKSNYLVFIQRQIPAVKRCKRGEAYTHVLDVPSKRNP